MNEEFNVPNNGITVTIDEITLIGPDGITPDAVSSVIRNPDGSVNVIFSSGNIGKFKAGPEADEMYQLISKYLKLAEPEERGESEIILEDWKFMIQYRIASVYVNAPDINITFENKKSVKFTGYSEVEIYELFTKYLTPDAVLFT